MAKIVTLIVLSFSLVVTTPTSFANAQAPNESSTSRGGPRKQLATIIFSGLAGAILGLSTLSFYGRPQDKLSNIAVGFALGIIGGAVFTTYKAATKPYDQYEVKNFYTEDIWQTTSIQLPEETQPKLSLGYSWDF